MKNNFLISLFFLILISPPQVFASQNYIDLTYDFAEETIFWPTSSPFKLSSITHGMTENNFFYASSHFETDEHGGTHMDAPIHFYENGITAEQITINQLTGDGVIIDVSKKAKNNPDYLVSSQDILEYEAKYGQINENQIILIRTSYGLFWPDAKKYLGTNQKGSEALKYLHFPGLSEEAAKLLVSRNIKAVGIDTASIDFGQSNDYLAHRVLAQQNIPVFENIANLDKLPENGFYVIALPMKIKNGTGAPLRIIAKIN